MTMQSHSALRGAVVLTLALIVAPVAAMAGVGAAGNCNPPNVEVRKKFKVTNTSGKDADDFHFYMFQDDRNSVVVNGAKASSDACDNVGVTLKNANGHKNPPPGNHGAQVDMTSCTIPAGATISVDVSLCMNEQNCLKLKDLEFTNSGAPNPGPPKPNGGFRARRPRRGGNGGNRSPGGGGQGAQQGNGGSGHWIHQICLENDDTRWLVCDELKLLASMTFYADQENDIDWAGILPVHDAFGHPPVCIPPGGRWCYFFQTTGAYVSGHIYMKYNLRVAAPGECPGTPPIMLRAELDDTGDDDVLVFGDHPVDGVIGANGLDYLTTVQPTTIDLGGSVPAIPADFFGPGSEPFVGTVTLQGQPFMPEFTDADTVIERLAPRSNEPVQTIPIELIDLHLTSTEPIAVTSHETIQSRFDALEPTTTHIEQPPVQMGVSNDGGNVIDTEIIQLSLTGAAPPFAIPRLEIRDSGGPPGAFGPQSFFDIFYEIPPETESFFDVFVELIPPFGTGHLPMLPPTIAFTPGSASFDIFLSGIPVDFQTMEFHQLHCELNPAQPVQLLDAQLSGYGGESAFHIGVQLHVSGPLDPTQPVLTATIDGAGARQSLDFFDVFFDLDLQEPSTGTMTVFSSPSGGTFSSQITLAPWISFSHVGEPPDPNLVLSDVPPFTITQAGPHGWQPSPPSLPVPGSGPNFFPDASTPLGWIAPDGTPHTLMVANPVVGSTVRADFDADGDVDRDDLMTLVACATGPAIPYDPSSLPLDCNLVPDADNHIAADLDGDGDVDMDDAGCFQLYFGGANRWPGDGCGE